MKTLIFLALFTTLAVVIIVLVTVITLKIEEAGRRQKERIAQTYEDHLQRKTVEELSEQLRQAQKELRKYRDTNERNTN